MWNFLKKLFGVVVPKLHQSHQWQGRTCLKCGKRRWFSWGGYWWVEGEDQLTKYSICNPKNK